MAQCILFADAANNNVAFEWFMDEVIPIWMEVAK